MERVDSAFNETTLLGATVRRLRSDSFHIQLSQSVWWDLRQAAQGGNITVLTIRTAQVLFRAIWPHSVLWPTASGPLDE
jgi:hypothetical protein